MQPDDTSGPVPNPNKVRLGLAFICVVVAVSTVLVFAVPSPAGKALMFAIGVSAFVRLLLLFRSIRRDARDV